MLLDDLPLTPSGKTDRRALVALPRPSRPASPPAAVAPVGLWEEIVATAVAAQLGTPVGPEDDFFLRGGDSLRAVRLAAELERRTGVPLRISDVFAAPTPRGLAGVLAERRGTAGTGTGTGARADLAPVLTLRAGSGTPLVLLPPAGGLGWCYAGLLPHLPPGLPVHAVQDASFSAADAPRATTLGGLAAWQLAQVRRVLGPGRFHVAGWSIGGMCAPEVAAAAVATGQDVGAVVLLDAYPAEQWRALAPPTPDASLRAVLRMAGVEHLAPADAALDLAGAVALLRRSGSALGALPDDVLAASLATVRHGTHLVRTGEHRVVDRDLTHVAATAPRPEAWLEPAGWKAWTTGAVHHVPVDTTHGELLRPPAAATVAAAVAAAVERADRAG